MKKSWQIVLLCSLVCVLTVLPLAAGCLAKETPSLVREKGALNLWDTGPITLDPAISCEMASHTYVMQIFSGLVRLGADSKPAPDIAASWDRSSDGKTYTFHLRKGVRFHNGKEVTAQDFKYSWERACSPEIRSQTAPIYLGDIVGVKDVLEGKTTQINGIEVIDNYTLRVTIDAPKAYFLAKLTYPTAFVVDRDNVKSGKRWWQKPNGTGPFKLREWKTGNVLVLEPNQYYYSKRPSNKVVFHLLAGMPIAMYEMDEIDVVEVDENYIDKATDQKGPFYKELAVFSELSLFYIGFNIRKPPFDDINIRRAFCHAINKQRIIKLALKGMVTEAQGILPPNMPGHNPNIQGIKFDVSKAKSLITSSKYGSIANLPPIVLTTSGWGGNIPEYLGAIIQDWQQNLGVKVTVRQLEPEIFSYHLREEADEMFLSGWIADYPDPQNFLDVLFHSGAEYNTGDYNNSDVDALLDRAAIEPDEVARFALYQKAEQILVDEAACLPLWFGKTYILIKPYVKNYRLDVQGIPTLSEVYVEK